MHGFSCRSLLALLILSIPLFAQSQNSSFSFVYGGPTQIFVGEDCLAVLEWGHPNTPTAISNLPGGSITSFDIMSISGGYQIGDQVPPGEVVTVLYQATDNFNNTALFGFGITIVDNIPPEFDLGSLPQDLVVSCVNDIPSPADVTGFDNCMGPDFQFTITLTEDGSADQCDGGVITRTWVADDDLGNQASYTQNITVLPDTTDPSFVVAPMDGSGACANAMSLYAAWIDEQRNNIQASDDGCGEVEVTDNAPDPGIFVDFCGEIPVLFTASDQCGNSVSTTATFFILNETPPTITTQASNDSANCNFGNPQSAFQNWINNNGGAEAEDDCGSVVWSTIPENPTLGDTCATSREITFVADDGCGNIAMTSAIFTVIDTTAPQITNDPTNRIINCASFDIETELRAWLANYGGATANDLCTAVDDLTVEFQIEGQPLDTLGILSVIQDSIQTGCEDNVLIGPFLLSDVLAIVDVDFVFRDRCGNGASTSALFVLQDGVAPVIDSAAQDMIISCDTSATLEEAFANWYMSAGGAVATDDCGLIIWRGEPTFEEAFAQLTAALDTSCGEDAVVEVSFFAEDFCGLSAAEPTVASFGLLDTIVPTLLSPAGDLVFACDTNASQALIDWLDDQGGAIAEDDCASLNWQFQFVNQNGDTIVGISGSGPYPELTDLSCSQGTSFEFTGSDFCGNAVITTAEFQFIDTIAPQISVGADSLSVSCEAIPSIDDVTVTDNCPGAQVQIDIEDMVLGDTSMIDCDGFTILRRWIAQDECGNIAIDTQLLFVSDQVAPTFVVPTDTIVDCATADSIQAGLPTSVNDNCDIDPSISFSDSMMTSGCDLVILRTWTVNDACGNFTEQTQTITVLDSIGPEILSCLDSLVLPLDEDTCAAMAIIDPPNAMDLCSPSDRLIYSYSLDGASAVTLDSLITQSFVLSGGTHVLLWTIQDCAQNISECSTTIIVEDFVEPEIICGSDVEAMATDSCSAEIDLPLPSTITDNCVLSDLSTYFVVNGATNADSINFNANDVTVKFSFNVGDSEVGFIVRDPFGNADTCTINVRIQDATNPIAICRDFNVEIDALNDSEYQIGFDEIDDGSSDQCEIDSFEIIPPVLNCNQSGDVEIVSLYVFDESGNSDTCQALVTVSTTALQIGFETNLCSADSLQLLSNLPADTAGTITFSWTGPANFNSNVQNPLLTPVDSTNAGVYQLFVVGASGCEQTDSVEVVISSQNIPTIEASSTYCVGDSIFLIGSEYADMVTYQWFVGEFPNGALVASGPEPALGLFADVDTTIQYYLLVESAECTIGPSEPFSIEVNSIPIAMIEGDTLSGCIGDSVLLMSSNQGNGLDYTWTGPMGYESKDEQPDPIELVGNNLGIYTLQVIQDGCVSELDTVVIDANNIPPTPIVSGDSIFCNGSDLVLFASVDGANEYQWINPQGDVIVTTEDSLVVQNVGPEISGPWFVVAVEGTCTSDTSAQFEVGIALEQNIEVVNSGPVCIGDSVELTVNQMLEGASYNWSGPNGFTADTPNSKHLPDTSGIYQLTVQTENGCSVMASTEVTVLPVPIINMITVDVDSCASGITDATLVPFIDGNSTSGFTFLWAGPGVASVDSVLVIPNVSEANNGVYELIVSNGACQSLMDSVTIDVSNIPEAPSISGQQLYCAGDTVTLVANGSFDPNAVYTWTMSNDTVVESTGILQIDQAQPGASGSYQVSVDQGGCKSEASVEYSIEIIEALQQPVIVSSPKVCEGDTIFLSVENEVMTGSTYAWVGPANFASSAEAPFVFPATPLAEGNYFVEVTNGPCVSPMSNAFFIEVVARPETPEIESMLADICLDQENPFEICLDESTLSAGATYTWTNSENGEVIGSSQSRCIDVADLSQFVEGNNSIFVETEVDGCRSFSSPVASFEAFAFPDEIAMVDSNLFVCLKEAPIISANEPEFGIGTWTSTNDLLVFLDEGSAQTEVMGLSEGENTVIWTLSFEACQNFSADTGFIVVEPFPEPIADTIIVDFGQTANFNVLFNDLLPDGFSLQPLSSPTRGNVLNQGDGDFIYTPNIGYVGEDQFTYEICSNACPEQCGETVVILRVGTDDDCFVPTIFTPNQDGVNDQLIVPCLLSERFPNNRVVIFNQWGDEVYAAAPYQNDWDGTRNGKDLPVATYYYIVDFGDGSEVRKGFLVLER